jgi:hypothetical protein
MKTTTGRDNSGDASLPAVIDLVQAVPLLEVALQFPST